MSSELDLFVLTGQNKTRSRLKIHDV